MIGNAELERRDVLYGGHVQGVGFRYNTCLIARGYQITGFVQNLEDGRVKLVVEGPRSEVRSFLDDVAQRLDHYIQDIGVDVKPATGQFVDFGIR